MVCLHFLFFMDGLLSGSIPNPPLLDSEVGANLKQEASWMGHVFFIFLPDLQGWKWETHILGIYFFEFPYIIYI